jgi:oligopeptide transport system substrate-binding protein
MGRRQRALGVALALSLATSGAGAEVVLHRGNGAEPETLDIHKSSGVPEANIQRDLFEGLIAEAADGSHVPGAAARWEVDPSGTRYTFYLRPDGRWSDGTPLTAHDFVYAFRRALDPETASDYAFILWPVKGAEAVSKGEVRELERLGVVALDDWTLEITLKAPTPYFLGLLTHHMAYPAPRHAIEAHGARWTRPGNMVSNGPYRLAEWVPQSHIKLVRNELYRERSQVAIEAVTYYPTEDTNTELKRFRAGELDVTSDVPSDQVPWVAENLGQAFRNSPYLGTYYYALNTGAAPFKDALDLRRALALAIDRETLVAKVTRAGEIPAYAWVPPGVLGYRQQPIPQQGLSQAERQALARELFAQAGYGSDNPLSLEILYNTSENHKKIAIAVAAMWRQVLGVRARLRNEEWKVYLDTRSQMRFEVARGGWIGDYNDANTFLELMKSDVGEMNPSGYANPEYDRLIKQAEVTADAARRAELMQRAERLMLSQMPIIPIYFYTTQHLVAARVRGWIDNVMDVHPTRYLSIVE